MQIEQRVNPLAVERLRQPALGLDVLTEAITGRELAAALGVETRRRVLERTSRWYEQRTRPIASPDEVVDANLAAGLHVCSLADGVARSELGRRARPDGLLESSARALALEVCRGATGYLDWIVRLTSLRAMGREGRPQRARNDARAQRLRWLGEPVFNTALTCAFGAIQLPLVRGGVDEGGR